MAFMHRRASVSELLGVLPVAAALLALPPASPAAPATRVAVAPAENVYVVQNRSAASDVGAVALLICGLVAFAYARRRPVGGRRDEAATPLAQGTAARGRRAPPAERAAPAGSHGQRSRGRPPRRPRRGGRRDQVRHGNRHGPDARVGPRP